MAKLKRSKTLKVDRLIYTINDIRHETGLCKATIRSWIYANKIPVMKVGRAYAVTKDTMSKIMSGYYEL